MTELGLIFVDTKTGRGGGQVVLEELLRRCASQMTTSLVMPKQGQRCLVLPANVQLFERLDDAIYAHRGQELRIVANANAAFPGVLATVLRLPRRQRRTTTSIAIVHNYPSTLAKSVATTWSLKGFSHVYVVEPGLLSLREDAIVPPWLSLRPQDPVVSIPRIARTGRVKSFGRPDASKGLHLLGEIFETLEQRGWSCEVALGNPLDGNRRYERRLRSNLGPWLTDGSRTPEWVDAGDIFVLPSVSGEAACLSAQEVLARGAFVVASRVGLMPYLLPEGQSMTTFAVGDTSAAADAVDRISMMADEEFSAACLEGAHAIASRRGAWYDYVVERLCSCHGR